ncbi:MAG: thiamine pyrophosphate-dependent enzyme [Candidatus Hydrothermales bacterium]
MRDIFEIIDRPQNFPYCPGCGHTTIDMVLARAIFELGLKNEDFVIVSDIGCVGLVDKLFRVHTVHTLHGRSTAVAAGIKMVDEVLFDNKLKVVVMIGDGGSTIGLLHLVEAAKINVDITVLIHNNFLYGMTGGQHSGLTPKDFKTSTTLNGNPFEPLKIIDILKNSGATFYARTYSQDPELKEIIKEALLHRGFAVVEILELCTGYATRYNEIKGSGLKNMLDNLGGKVKVKEKKESFGEIYKNKFFDGKGEVEFKGIEIDKRVSLKEPLKIVIAGSAGEGVQLAASLLCYSSILAGLNATQKNDNPVTVGSGFSVSEVIISERNIKYSGIEKPNYLIITSIDGFKRVKNLLNLSENVIIDETLTENKSYFRIPARRYLSVRGGPNYFSIGFLFGKFSPFESEIFEKAILKYGKSKEEVLKVFKEGVSLGKSYGVQSPA